MYIVLIKVLIVQANKNISLNPSDDVISLALVIYGNKSRYF